MITGCGCIRFGEGCGLRWCRDIKLFLTLWCEGSAQNCRDVRMNLYHCSIDLRDTAKAVAFAVAVEAWMGHLQQAGVIGSWRLCRRKLGFGAPRARDFLLEVEVADMAQLDQAFRFTGSDDEGVERLYTSVHQMVGDVDIALYRPFPDPERAERMALI